MFNQANGTFRCHELRASDDVNAVAHRQDRVLDGSRSQPYEPKLCFGLLVRAYRSVLGKSE
jgi:hypothetical protein